MSRILDEIRKQLTASGMTRYEIAKQTGIDQAQLSRLMAGKEGVGLGNLDLLAKALGLEIVIRPMTRTRKGR